MIGHGDDSILEESVDEQPAPWSALFLGGAKMISKSTIKKRRSRSIDMSPRPATAAGRDMGRASARNRANKLRRRSSSIDSPKKQYRPKTGMGLNLPRYLSPQFQALDLSLNESELENGPGSPLPRLHIDQTCFGDSDDNSVHLPDENQVHFFIMLQISFTLFNFL